MDFESGKKRLSELGIQLDGHAPRWTIHALCKKTHWQEPKLAELGWIDGSDLSYEVIFTNLPYVLGSRWRELSDGKPVQIECQNVNELVELFTGTFSHRIVQGVLQVA